MLFELRALAQNALLGVAPIRHVLHRRLGRTGMNGDLGMAQSCLETYLAHVDITGKHVLELGPGHTPHVLLLALERGASRCVGLDLERHVDAGPFEARGVELMIYDGRRMPFEEPQFDVVWSSDVLEHVRHPEQTLAESWRVLRTEGTLIAAIDLRDHYFLDREAMWLNCLKYPEPLWLAMCSNRSSYVNRLRSSEWRALFERSGFSIVEFEERRSRVLEELHVQNRLRRHGRTLSASDAPVYRIDVVARKKVR